MIQSISKRAFQEDEVGNDSNFRGGCLAPVRRSRGALTLFFFFFFFLVSNKLIMDERLSDRYVCCAFFSLQPVTAVFLKVRPLSEKVHLKSRNSRKKKKLILIPSLCLLNVLQPLCGPEMGAIAFKLI